MKRTFVLLVGINNYPSPVSTLRGCVRDVDQIEAYLRAGVSQWAERHSETEDGIPFRTYGPLHLCRLIDEQASYRRIVQAFRGFLCQAGPGDAVWFHFSGHGSEEFTAEAFLHLEPNGKDQTLLCFRRTEADGQLHLADKELAVLLHEVSTRDTEGRPKEAPHMVVSLDCCHSGSGTRDVGADAELKIRGIKVGQGSGGQILVRGESAAGRSLVSYADGYYERQWRERGQLQVPVAPHVLLSACESIQKAGDLPFGGVFTSSLIRTLEQARGAINYADLFVRTRAMARRLRADQTPQFESIGRFDPYTRFLDGAAFGNPDRYEVVHEGGQWLVKCGAIHGLPVAGDQPIELEIQTMAAEPKPVARAEITGVGAQKSAFRLTSGGWLDTDRNYEAILRFLPALPVFVWLHGDAAGVALLKQHWDRTKNIQWTDDPEQPDSAGLEVEATGRRFVLRDRRAGRTVLSRPQEPGMCALIVGSLGKLVRWERTVYLDNPHSDLSSQLSFLLGIADRRMQKTWLQASEVRLYVSGDVYFRDPKAGTIGLPFFPEILIRATGQPLYAYVLHLRANYSIESYEGEFVFRPAEHPGKTEVRLPLWKKTMGWGLSPGEYESTSYFKLLVTRAPLDYQQLLQSGIDGDRHSAFVWNPVDVDHGWASFTIKVTLVRAEVDLPAEEPQLLPGSQLTVFPAEGVRARLSLTAAAAGRSADPSRYFLRLQAPGLQLLDLREQSYPLPMQVLELSELQIEAGTDLAARPLTIHVARVVESAEYLLVIAFDGSNYRLIGRGEAGEDRVSIRELPDPLSGFAQAKEEMLPDPFDPEIQRHRSLFTSLRMAFYLFRPAVFDRECLSRAGMDLFRSELEQLGRR